MRKITALYGKTRNCTLRSENGENGSVFLLSCPLKDIDALYVYDGELYRLSLDGAFTAKSEKNINVREAFLVCGGKIAFEGGNDAKMRERLKSRILELEGRAFKSQAAEAIAAKARELFSPLDSKAENAENNKEESSLFNPFPEAFPRSVWKRVAYPGTSRYYLEGRAVKDGMQLLIYALPGEYLPADPHMSRSGFKKFMRACDGSGYWLKIKSCRPPMRF